MKLIYVNGVNSKQNNIIKTLNLVCWECKMSDVTIILQSSELHNPIHLLWWVTHLGDGSQNHLNQKTADAIRNVLWESGLCVCIEIILNVELYTLFCQGEVPGIPQSYQSFRKILNQITALKQVCQHSKSVK